MAKTIMTGHGVAVDAQRLGAALQATYQIDEEIDLLEQLTGNESIGDHPAWRRLLKDALMRVRATNESVMACLDDASVSTPQLEARLRVVG